MLFNSNRPLDGACVYLFICIHWIFCQVPKWVPNYRKNTRRWFYYKWDSSKIDLTFKIISWIESILTHLFVRNKKLSDFTQLKKIFKGVSGNPLENIMWNLKPNRTFFTTYKKVSTDEILKVWYTIVYLKITKLN